MSDIYRYFHDCLDAHAGTTPDKCAIECDGGHVSYGALSANSHRAAAALVAAGLKEGDRLLYLGRSSIAFFELLFASSRLGLCFVSLNWRLTMPEITEQLLDCSPKLVFADQAFLGALPAGDRSGVVMLDGEAEGFPAYRAWRDAANPAVKYGTPDPEAPALMMYTSGTTARAKGVAVSQNAVLVSRRADGEYPGWGVWHKDEVLLVPTPLFHIAGCGWALIGLYYGLSLVLMRDFVPAQILEVIEKKQITRTIFVPAMLAFLLKEPGFAGTDVSSLRYLYYGAAPMPAPLLEATIAAFPKAGLIQLYGMTETCGYATHLPPEDHAAAVRHRRASAGKAYMGVEISIRDRNGQPLPQGEFGEVWIKTPTVMNGYWHNADATADVLSDGWYKSGDGGSLDPDGYLFLKDRIKDMIISGGENIFPSEVEAVLARHPALAEVSVFGVDHDLWGEQVQAALVLKPGAVVSDAELVDFAAISLASYKIPRAFNRLSALPRNASGKILKRDLREMFDAV